MFGKVIRDQDGNVTDIFTGQPLGTHVDTLLAVKPQCPEHPPMMNCNCTDTPAWERQRKKFVHQLMTEYWETHQDIAPAELIERWLGVWNYLF